ncbi:MAG: hypothetical protein JEY79_12055 [Pseudodesulfovibrio sp.]|nr:hypothetical protein [Pseudodesulfovibrio sp.]
MKDQNFAIIEEFRGVMPAVFAGTQIGERTGGTFEWTYFRNMRKKWNIPEECFIHSGNKLLIVRDVFLDWWLEQLTSEEGGAHA